MEEPEGRVKMHFDFAGRGMASQASCREDMPCPALTVGRTWPALPASNIGYWKATLPGEGSEQESVPVVYKPSLFTNPF